MTPGIDTLYEDDGWSLLHDTRRYPNTAWYWLTHFCPLTQRDTYRYDGSFLHPSISAPCDDCGSECPPGIQGLYLTLAVL